MAFGLSRAARYRGRSTDEGFTIIEVVASLGIIAVAFAALTTVFWAGLRTAGVSSVRSRGVAVATRETEAIRAIPYAEVGFYADQTDYEATFESAPTVTLAPLTPATVTPRLQPTGTVTVGPVTFDVRRHITLVEARDSTTTFSLAYKKTTVLVTWTDDGGGHTIRQDSIVYPGALGPLTSTTTTAAPSPAVPPTAPVLSPPTPVSESQIDLVWAAGGGGGAVDHFVVERATNSTFTAGFVSSPNQPASATSYQVTGLAPSTTYWFRIRAYESTGLNAASNELSATTHASSSTTCSVASISVTGQTSLSTTKTYLKNNGKMDENLSLSIAASAGCNGTTLRIRSYLSSPSSADPDSPWTPTPLTGTNRSFTTASVDDSWAVGVHTFEVIGAAGSPLSPSVLKTFLVCADTNVKSTNPNQC